MSNNRLLSKMTRRKVLTAMMASAAGLVGSILLGKDTASSTAGATNSYNVKDFGATGDGKTDDTESIRLAFQTANVTGGIVVFPHGRYYISSQISLVVMKSITIVGNNATIFRDYKDITLPEEGIFHFTKGRLPSLNVTANIVSGSELLTLSSTAGLIKDTCLLITSDEIYSVRNNDNSSVYYKGFMTKVSEITSGNVVRVVNSIPHNISSKSNILVSPIANDALFEISNLNFEWVGTPAPNQLSNGLYLNTLSDIIINKIGFKNTTLAGLRFNNVYNANISDVIGSTARMDNQLNYGVLASSIYFSTFTNLYVNSHRHALSIGGIPSCGIKVDKCHLYSSGSQSGRSFDVHCGESAIVLNSVLPQGVNIAGGHYLFENCDISNNQYNPIVFLRRDLSFQKSLTIRNCRIKMIPSLASGYVYSLNPQSDLKDCGDFILENNEISGIAFGGLVAMLNISNDFNNFGIWQIRNNLIKTKIAGVIVASGKNVNSLVKGKFIIHNNKFSNASLVVDPSLNNIISDVDIRDNKPLQENDTFTIIVGGNTNVNIIQNVVTEGLIIIDNKGKTVIKGNEVLKSTKNPAANIMTGNADIEIIDNTTYESLNARFGFNIDKSSIFVRNNRNLQTDGIEGRLYYGSPAKILDSVNVGNAILPSHALNRSSLILTGSSSPTVIPQFIGQIYIDTMKGSVYMSTGTKSAADFKLLNK